MTLHQNFRRQKYEGSWQKEPTFKNVGLKQGRFVSRAMRLDTILCLNWALYPELKFLLILLSFCLLPSALCLSCKKIFFVSSTILCLSLIAINFVISAAQAQQNHTIELMEIHPEIKLVIHQDSMKGWNLEAKITNFKFAPEQASSSVEAGEGHAHLYINGEKITRLYSSWYYLGNLKPGKNEITVSLNTNNHQALAHNGKIIQDTAIVEVPVLRGNRE